MNFHFFFKKKINENKQLEAAVEQSEKDAVAFSEQVEKEIEIFETLKTQDFKGYFKSLGDMEVDFHQKVYLLNFIQVNLVN